MKRASNSLAAPIMKILFWLLIFAGATIVFFRLISRLPNEIPVTSQTPISGENSPTPTVAAESKTPQSLVSSTSAPGTSNSSILFNEDFEDGKAQKMAYISGGWQIIADETGNKVYDIDNSKGSGFPGIDFGSESWKDYEIKFKVRFLESAWAIVYFRSDGTTNGAYVASIDLTNTSLNYTTNGSNWKVMTNRENPLKKNTWYWVSIEANGAEIKVSINDSVVINTDDTLFNSGRITMQAGQYTHMQVDDIQVVPLEK